MKRRGNLYGEICSWDNLEAAARLTRKGKRYRKYAEDFELRRETRLSEIRDELLRGVWQPGSYRIFKIFDPKERIICGPSYADRVVHHALCRIIGPIFEKTLVDDTYSCRVNRGTGAARARCGQLVRRHSHVLKLDVAKYFPSIDHGILKEKIHRLIKCVPTLALIDRIIDSWRDETYGPLWFKGDELMTPLSRPKGLPIGALTSQLFANLYLSRIDHLVLEEIRPAGYIRYTDDLLLFSGSKTALAEAQARLSDELAKERLKPHRSKCRVHGCREGVPFLGFRYWPERVRVLRENRLRFEGRMRRLKKKIRCDRGKIKSVWPSIFGWFQFVREYASNEGLVIAECRKHVF